MLLVEESGKRDWERKETRINENNDTGRKGKEKQRNVINRRKWEKKLWEKKQTRINKNNATEREGKEKNTNVVGRRNREKKLGKDLNAYK